MANAAGTPIWYELLTPDPDAAQEFYAEVIGWSFAPSGHPGMDYRIISAPDGMPVAGLMKQQDGMETDAAWVGYLAVADVDAAVDTVEKAGGATHMPATAIDGVGRMAMLADPHGAIFYVMRGESSEESHAFQQADEAMPGHAVWNELSAKDPEAALAFYSTVFGWHQEGAMPMGELGDYRFLTCGTVRFGALMGEAPGGRLGWQYYFMVPDIDAAHRRLSSARGKAIHGPDEIPGGAFSMVCEDPHGARFGMVGPRMG
ncbi:VOC family protein [Aurantimonas sp. A2-1-M11]|uniref:VOC family protein n=1 Tax=Aurantimonas sp. A2-1-M11 TaxID=3113712 RepID=UPI002F94699A